MSDKSGGWIVAGTASGALVAGVAGAAIGAIVGWGIQEALKCPRCGNVLMWDSKMKQYICSICSYVRWKG